MRPAIFVLAAALIGLTPLPSRAACSRALCATDERYDGGISDARGAYGRCVHTSGLGYISTTLRRCAEGWTLDLASGQCTTAAACGCDERALCTGDGEEYDGSATDSIGPYGRCVHRSGLGYISTTLRRCPEGATLDVTRGMCRFACEVTRPDLVLRSVYARSLTSPTPLTAVPAGTSYYVCFTAANVGSARSGPFRVAGGGLGLPSSPFQDHASLLPGATRAGCLLYPNTPAPGSYRIGLGADSRDAVVEIREDNNGATLPITIVP
jgi:hypothetical protein